MLLWVLGCGSLKQMEQDFLSKEHIKHGVIQNEMLMWLTSMMETQ